MMTLQKFKDAIGQCFENAHLFVREANHNSGLFKCYSWERVASVSLHVDDDGVMSICLHSSKLENRVLDKEADDIKTAKEYLATVGELTDEKGLTKATGDEFFSTYLHVDMFRNFFELDQDADVIGEIESSLQLLADTEGERDKLSGEVAKMQSIIAGLQDQVEQLKQKPSTDAKPKADSLDEVRHAIFEKIKSSKDVIDIPYLCKCLGVKKDVVRKAVDHKWFAVDSECVAIVEELQNGTK